ncbi:DUF4157 domain-containing protein [Panacibacter microcysteis]|uniref:DUF4157 domain-containing protein n=1 Tax=Panacibacter microcysteis TaxID=2793269 RepID=UPI001E32FAB7|nr:DUF4157 domain-containing protein [Panacibacter microcysteis]
MRIQIREQSFIARIACIVLKQKKVAVVTGNIIHLYNTGKEEFLSNKRWLQHELVHVLQYREHGHLKFISLYLWESLKKGYHQNRFEKEARLYEDEPALSANVQVI